MNVLSFIITARDQASQVFQNVGKGLEKVRGYMSGVGGAIAGAFSATAITAFARSIVNYAGQVKDASAATGISVERFQALSIAARENGVGMDQLSGALGRLRNVQGSIADDQGMQNAFRKLGMTVAEVESADADGLLQRIARGIRDTGDASIAFDLFGRSAAGLLTTLNELADGWDPLVAKMRSGIISESEIERLDELGDILDTTQTKLKAWGATAAGALSDISAFFGNLSTGMGIEDAGTAVFSQKRAEADERKRQKAAMEEARKAAAKAEAERKDAAKLGSAQDEGRKLGEQYARAAMDDKQYEARLQEQVTRLAAEANEEGLTALERQTRMNEAMRVTLELMSLQKKLQADANAERQRELEKSNTETDAKRERLKAESQYKYRAKFEAATPEKRLAMTEQNIKRWQGRVKSAGTEQEKLEATKGLIGQLEVRDQLKTDIKAAQDKAAADRQSAIDKEREKAVKPEPERRSIGIGEVAEKAYAKAAGKTLKPKDPQAAQLKVAEETRDLIKRIVDMGPGGMTK
jgi:hypothetical protein